MALAVEDKVKFVRLVADAEASEALPKRTPMGLPALKAKPSAALKPKSAANCKAIRRVNEAGAATRADLGCAGAVAAGCDGAGADPRCGLRFLRPLPMRTYSSSQHTKGQCLRNLQVAAGSAGIFAGE